uniref:Sushi domain containing 5 n=1 Tax=Fundulus heteroclitus TaxID=8078 RepID=A0A3Q2PJ62_FUNHE
NCLVSLKSNSLAHLPLPSLDVLSAPDSWLHLSTGRVFVLDLRSLQGFREAEQACASQHARLASAEELHRVVAECFFSHCTRGWLYGVMVGTTVCNTEGSSLKAVNVKTENATEAAAHLSAFCTKDKAVACGDPPSFPNARLQDHSGFEMGDELMYTCVPGYVMPSGSTAFSLLCDSCGEWYGTVQICVKDAAETHVDYDDKFENSHEEADRDHDSREEEDGFTIHPRRMQEGNKLVQAGDGAAAAAAATEEPVSLLSQKHMFWFPSEAFQEEVPYDDHDSHEDSDDHPHVVVSVSSERRPNTTQREAGSKTSKDNSWLDGHPVDLSDTENGDSTKRQLRPSVAKTTDKPSDVEVHRRVPHNGLSDGDGSPTVPPKSDHEAVKEVWPGFRTPATSSDRSDRSNPNSNSDTLDYDTQQAAPTHSWLDDLTDHPFLDHGPAPPVRDGDAFPAGMEEHTVDNLPGEMGEMEGEKRKTICAGEDCPPHPPSSTSQGAKVAAIIVAVCAVATAVIVGVWCYRRKQQKSSMYEMNGKGQGQSRQGQQIEMQQKV